MRIETGQTATPVRLPAIDGSVFDTATLRGCPYLLAFFRFAGCPFCNLRVHDLVSRFDELGDDFTVVAVFDSPLDNLARHAGRHDAPFPILADADNAYYRAWGIEHSLPGMLKGMIFRFPTLLKGLAAGYVPLVIKGSVTTMPAEFLIDRGGVVRQAYYGSDEGDHLPFEIVRDFSTR